MELVDDALSADASFIVISYYISIIYDLQRKKAVRQGILLNGFSVRKCSETYLELFLPFFAVVFEGLRPRVVVAFAGRPRLLTFSAAAFEGRPRLLVLVLEEVDFFASLAARFALITACAPARRAAGTRNGEQDT